MKDFLNNPIFESISAISQQMQIKSFIVGGYVRDLLINRDSKDIDIVVLGEGINFAEKVAEKLGNNTSVKIFKNFGTVMLKFNDLDIERNSVTQIYDILKKNNNIHKWFYGHFHDKFFTEKDGVQFHGLDIMELKECFIK